MGEAGGETLDGQGRGGMGSRMGNFTLLWGFVAVRGSALGEGWQQLWSIHSSLEIPKIVQLCPPLQPHPSCDRHREQGTSKG